MSNIKYSEDHEWLVLNGDGTATIGITDFAQDQLGELVFIELPEVDQEVDQGDSIAVIESVKSASELICPVSGTVVEVNEVLADSPELVNDDAMGAGWFVRIELSDPSEVDDLMDEDAYQSMID